MTARSVVGIIPASYKDTVNRMWRMIGRDDTPDPGATFGIGLSPDGSTNYTHFGMHDSSATAEMAATWLAFHDGVCPVPPSGTTFEDWSLTEALVSQCCAVLTIDVGVAENMETYPVQHFTAVASNLGLQRHIVIE